jgi:hypothetical protein
VIAQAIAACAFSRTRFIAAIAVLHVLFLLAFHHSDSLQGFEIWDSRLKFLECRIVFRNCLGCSHSVNVCAALSALGFALSTLS